MTAFWAWLAGTKAGRWLLGGLAMLAAFAALLLKTFFAGRAAEERKTSDATLQAANSRKTIGDTTRGLGTADVRRRLRLWRRPD